jgi:imidazolonepropionase-like amidohydrolase
MTPSSSARLLVPDLVVDPPGAARPGLAVLVDSGRVVAVGPVDELRFAGLAIDVLPGQTLLPGLIDAHLHLEFRPVDEDAEVIRLLAVDHAAGASPQVALANARTELIAGVTTVRDCASSIALLEVREAIAGGVAGPRIIACGPPITKTAGHLSWTGLIAEDDAAVRSATRELCDRGVDAIKVVTSGGTMTPGSAPERAQFTLDELRAIVDVATTHGRRVVAHALNAEAIRRAAVAGVQTIDHARWNDPGGVDAYDPAVAADAIDRGVVFGLTASGWTRRRALGGDEDLAYLRVAFAGHRRLIADGAMVGVHTDAGATETAFGHLVESMRVAALVADMPAAQLLASVTRIAATSIGLAAEIGSLAPGYRADLIAVSGNPLADLSALERVERVYRDGELVVEDGRLVGTVA